MKVLMLGWEFPPFISGGLGTACYGLTRAMDQLGLEVTFVLPKAVSGQYATHVELLSPDNLPSDSPVFNQFKIDSLKNVTFRTIETPLEPYDRPDTYQQKIENIIHQKQQNQGQTSPHSSHKFEVKSSHSDYGRDMHTEIHRYTAMVTELALKQVFDVIHAHDWMTYPAGVAVAAITGKPLVVQVHSTEFDRSGENVNQMIYDIERRGIHAADKVIAVSHFTRDIIISRYGVSGDKVEVVHNGVERNGNGQNNMLAEGIKKDEKIVLFLGRITMQKGPEYFLEAAKKVLDVMDNVKFVMVGSGDMMQRIIEMAAHLGIGSKILFTGFLRGDDVEKIYRMADLYVMPSVSEPFGIAPLEALDNDVPVIISRQSGVSEVLTHALKVDFWDTNEMANKIVAVLKYPPLRITLQNHGNFEVRKLRWKDSAAKCMQVYQQTLVMA